MTINFQQAYRFINAAAFSSLLTFILPIILHEGLAISEPDAVAIGFCCAFVTNFFLQRLYVFKNRTNFLQQAGLFIFFSIIWRLGEYYLFLTMLQQGFNYILALLIVLGASTVIKYGLCKWVIFGPGTSRETVD